MRMKIRQGSTGRPGLLNARGTAGWNSYPEKRMEVITMAAQTTKKPPKSKSGKQKKGKK